VRRKKQLGPARKHRGPYGGPRTSGCGLKERDLVESKKGKIFGYAAKLWESETGVGDISRKERYVRKKQVKLSANKGGKNGKERRFSVRP